MIDSVAILASILAMFYLLHATEVQEDEQSDEKEEQGH